MNGFLDDEGRKQKVHLETSLRQWNFEKKSSSKSGTLKGIQGDF